MTKPRKPPAGARPGTLAIDPAAPRPSISAMVYSPESVREVAIEDPRTLAGLNQGGSKLWVDVQGLGDESTLRALGEIFSIHPLALEDVVHRVRPKSEGYEENLLIVTRMIRGNGGASIDAEQVGIVVGEDYVLTFQERPGDVLEPVRQRMRLAGSRIRQSGSDYLAYAILDAIVDAYFPVVEEMAAQVEVLEEQVLAHASPETLRELNDLKRRLLGLRRAVAPQRETLNALIRGDSAIVSEPVRIFLRDTYDHIVQTAEAVDGARELVNGLMNTYLSVVSNRMNEVMKTLTIVASIFVPLTFMAGIYGMNFENMPELGRSWAYPTLLGIMGLTALGMLVYFWRKGWIGRGR